MFIPLLILSPLAMMWLLALWHHPPARRQARILARDLWAPLLQALTKGQATGCVCAVLCRHCDRKQRGGRLYRIRDSRGSSGMGVVFEIGRTDSGAVADAGAG